MGENVSAKFLVSEKSSAEEEIWKSTSRGARSSAMNRKSSSLSWLKKFGLIFSRLNESRTEWEGL